MRKGIKLNQKIDAFDRRRSTEPTTCPLLVPVSQTHAKYLWKSGVKKQWGHKKKPVTWIIEKNNQTARRRRERRRRRSRKRGENGFTAPPNDAIVKTQTEFIISALLSMTSKVVLYVLRCSFFGSFTLKQASFVIQQQVYLRRWFRLIWVAKGWKNINLRLETRAKLTWNEH